MTGLRTVYGHTPLNHLDFAARKNLSNFGLSDAQVFTDYKQCMEQTQLDMAILCPATTSRASNFASPPWPARTRVSPFNPATR